MLLLLVVMVRVLLVKPSGNSRAAMMMMRMIAPTATTTMVMMMMTTTAASFATHRRNHVSRNRWIVVNLIIRISTTGTAPMRRSTRRRDHLIQTSCVHNLHVGICTVVHTTAKTITITTVAHVRPNASTSAAVHGSAAGSVHVIFSPPGVPSRLIRCPWTRRLLLLLAIQILIPTAVVR